MPSTRIADRQNKIIEIVWDGNVKPEEVDAINEQVMAFAKQLGSRFDVIVDMRTMKAFLPASQARLIEHQKDIKAAGMDRAAVVVASAISKIQLRRTAKESGHTTESHWDDYDKALAYLRNEIGLEE